MVKNLSFSIINFEILVFKKSAISSFNFFHVMISCYIFTLLIFSLLIKNYIENFQANKKVYIFFRA